MSVLTQRYVVPQHSGNSITYHAMDSDWDLYPPTLTPRGGKSRGGRSNMSPAITPKANRSRAGSLGRKHVRTPSNNSATGSTTAFPTFDTGDDSIITPLPSTYTEFNKSRSASHSSTKAKIKPFLRKKSSTEKSGSLDLSRSQAENEGLGIYTSSNNMRRETSASSNGLPRIGHARTSSAVSQISTTTASSARAGGGSHYVHPMRQTPLPYTPPINASHHNSRHHSRANSDDGDGDDIADGRYASAAGGYVPAKSTSYAPMPGQKRTQSQAQPPSSTIRTQASYNRLYPTVSSHSNTNLPSTIRYHDGAASNTAAGSFSPEPNAILSTARSSLESAFRMRSRSNTAGTGEGDHETVARLRAEWAAKEAAKKDKYAQSEKRAAEKEARRQERRHDGRKRREEDAQRKRAKSNAASEKSVPLSVEYSSTTALPVDEELEYIRRGQVPPPRVRAPIPAGGRGSGERGAPAGHSGLKKTKGRKAGRAVNSGWDRFWFAFKTMWLKFKRGVGMGEKS